MRNRSHIQPLSGSFASTLLVAIFAISGLFSSAVSAKNEPAPEVSKALHRHATKPLTEMAKTIGEINPSRKRKLQARGEKVPGDGSDYAIPNQPFPFKLNNRHRQKSQNSQKDGARQSKAAAKVIPDPIVSFPGIPNVMAAVPPDTNGDVGPNHYVQSVNTALAVWDKQGNQLLAPVALNSLWSGLGGLCESTNRGDPIVLYDSMADRWLISQFAFNDAMTDNRQCIAISQTPDPTQAYYVYDFEFDNVKFNDYPKFGVWQDGYYMSVNQFIGNNYANVAVVAYEREAMLNGASAQQVKIDLTESFPKLFSILPADHDGVIPAPADSPNYFFAVLDDWFHEVPADVIQVFKFVVDWENPASSTFTMAQEMPIAAMDMNIETSEIVQPNGVTLDSLRGYAMYRLAYRNMGDYGALVVNHNVDADSAGQAGIRWYEVRIDNSSGDISLNQQGTFAPSDGVDRWMGSIAMDAVGNIAVGYNATSNQLHPSVYYTGRLSTDPAGELSQGEGVIVAGTGSQGNVNRSRWADYSSLSVDPSDDCTFWYTNEYYKAADDNTTNWATQIGSFKFPNCTALPTGFVSGKVIDATTEQPVVNVRVTAGALATHTDADGNYSLRLPVDSYELTYDSYWYQASSVSNVAVAENETTVRDITLNKAPTIAVTGKITDGSGQGWPLYAKIEIDIPNNQDLDIYSDPFTGQYTVDLVPNIAVPFIIDSQVIGYAEKTETITPAGDAPVTQDFDLKINVNACNAPGYKSNGLFQNFDGDFIADGWQSVDENSSGQSWGSTTSGRDNVTGGEGEAALIDSDAAGSVTIDTSLVSPTLAVASLNGTTLSYLANFQTSSAKDNFDLDIRTDDSERWQNIIAWTGNHGEFAGPGELVNLDIASHLDGVTNFQLRWHYYNADDEWFAQVDDVSLGHTCVTDGAGSLVAGYITDANTDGAVVGATINAKGKATSQSTSGDSAVADGIYFVFADQNTTEMSVTSSNYADVSTDVSPVAGTLVRKDIQLSAALIEIAPNPIEVSVAAGRISEQTITITNSGSATGTYSISEINAAPDSAAISQLGRFDVGLRYSGPKDMLKLNAGHIRDYRPPYVAPMAPGDATEMIDVGRTGFAFGVGVDQHRDSLWFGSVSALDLGGDDHIHRYQLDGVKTDDTIDASSILDTDNGFVGDLAFNSRTNMLWISEVDDEFCIHEINPESLAFTGNKICPEGLSVSQQGLAYDPVTDTFFSGSWSDSVVHRFSTQGELLSSINTGLAVAGLAYNPASERLYVSVNAEAPELDVAILNVSDYSVVGGFNVLYDLDEDGTAEDAMDDLAQGGLSINCDGSIWMVEQSKKLAFKIDTDEPGACLWGEVSWLGASASGELAAEANEEKSIVLNSSEVEVGTYQAQLLVDNNSPYGSFTVPVTLNVTAPQYGTLQFLVTNAEVDEEQNLEITVERTGGADFAVSVDYTTVDGTAVAGTEYTETSGTLNWVDLDGEAKIITVPITTVDSNKSFSVELSNVQGGAVLGENTKITLAVKDKPKGSGGLGFVAISLLIAIGVFRRRMLHKN
ncbi:carboxypeptidase regulatory-like domain-containing protein [Aliikangiella coralliicola]|uniref:PKD domain-containing protein n=1 Tax=Aliikangiella coralliicola TaxID=2592383 RepID=A0A545UIK6_9GAMM|nr:carboxypeptidase regulatory-like domain-containing protein [Aliikangiella coralliicola]TQV89263.1 PKD domain-containing protein [Aliikangiella coralliicola]